MPKIVENELLRIPLYHGTSSLFQDSIQKYGLGAVNPLIEYSVPSFVKLALDVCNKALANDQVWEYLKFAPSWIVTQESFNDAANFQHGDTYLTPSRASAVSYALTNQYGSEMLSMGYKLYSLATERCPDLVRETGLDQHPVVNLFSATPSPILIVAYEVPVSSLLSEGGGAPQQAIRQLEGFYEFLDNTGALININFRLQVPLLPTSFSIESIDPKKERNLFDW